MNITEGGRKYHAVNGILTHYHLRLYPYLGLGRFSIKKNCTSIEYSNTMDLSRDTLLEPIY